MAFTAFRGMGAWAQLIMAAFIVLVCFLLLFILSIPAALPFIGFSELMDALTSGDPDNPLTIAVLKYFQVVQSIGLFVIPPVLIGWLFSGNIARYLQLDRKVEVMALLLAIGAVLIINPFISYVGELNSKMSLPGFLSGLEEWTRKMEDQAAQLIDRFMEVKTLGGLLFNLFMIAVIPAVGEEFLFRGVFQKIFTQMTRNYHWGIWVSAFLFSALHMQFYGFVPRMLLGALFGYMLVYSGSLWLPIACHFVNNALGVLYLYFEKQGVEEVGRLSEIGEKTIYMVPLAAASLILTIWLILALRKRSGRLKGEIDL